MGDIREHQPLTMRDKVSVVLYRTGIVLTAITMAIGALAYFYYKTGLGAGAPLVINSLLGALYLWIGLSVFTIHLYVSKFGRFLKSLYGIAAICLLGLFIAGGGDVARLLSESPAFILGLLPLSGCLGFITAKEAFCFRLTEGYILAFAMPLNILMLSTGSMSRGMGFVSYSFIALLMVLFTLRKAFMPLHFDIGDKSLYQ